MTVMTDREHVSDVANQLSKTPVSRTTFLKAAGAATVSAAGAGLFGGVAPAFARSMRAGFTQIPFYTTEDDPNTQAVHTAAAEDFSSAHPGVTISINYISNADRDQRILTGLSVGQDLGIFEIGGTYRAEFAEGGFLYPMDSLIHAIGADQFAVGSRMVIGGHDYVFPYGGGLIGEWTRTDVLHRLGLGLPHSFKDLVAVARGASKLGLFGLGLPVGTPTAVEYALPAFIYAQGGDYFDPHGDVIFGSPAVLQAIENYVELLPYAPPGNTTWSFPQLIMAYLSGRVTMVGYPGRLGFNLVGKAPQLVPATTVIFPPLGPQHVAQWRWSYLGIDKKTKHPDIALAFVRFLFTKYGVQYADSVPGQLIPSVKSVRDAWLKTSTSPYMKAHHGWVKTLADGLPYSYDISLAMGSMAGGKLKLTNNPPPPWGGRTFGVNGIDGQMIARIKLSGESPKAAQKWATQQLQKTVAAWKAEHPGWKPPV
jgi:ABC-type glycerol-3-phosphate transport system substrate-binding protein